MILTVLQPSYFLPIAECARLLLADVVVFAETFSFKKNDVIHRTAVKTLSGRSWLSVPVLSRHRQGQMIRNMLIDANQPWSIRHWRTLECNYRNSPYYYLYADVVQKIIFESGEKLIDLLFLSEKLILHALKMPLDVVSSYDLSFQIKDRTERVLSWLEACNCDTYLLRPYETVLIDCKALFNYNKKVQVFTYQDYPYHQQFYNFLPGLSILDLLFNEGPLSKSILYKGINCQKS